MVCATMWAIYNSVQPCEDELPLFYWVKVLLICYFHYSDLQTLSQLTGGEEEEKKKANRASEDIEMAWAWKHAGRTAVLRSQLNPC